MCPNGPTLIEYANYNFCDEDELYGVLSSVFVHGMGGVIFEKITDLYPFSNIRSLRMIDVILDDISVLEDFKQLEYISLYKGFSTEQKNYIKQILPNCKIIDY